jgi:hypothetical protein
VRLARFARTCCGRCGARRGARAPRPRRRRRHVRLGVRHVITRLRLIVTHLRLVAAAALAIILFVILVIKRHDVLHDRRFHAHAHAPPRGDADAGGAAGSVVVIAGQVCARRGGKETRVRRGQTEEDAAR